MATQTPKPKAKQVRQPAAGQHAAKKKGRLSGGAFVSIILLVLVLGACAAVYLNLAGAKDAVAGVLGLTTIESASELRAEAQAEIDAQTAEIANEKAALRERENALEARERDLIEREAAVSDLEDTTEEQEQDTAELAAAGEIFAQMDPESAAEAIAGMESVDEMVKILTHMPSDQAALVMDEMDSDLASDILSAMMK